MAQNPLDKYLPGGPPAPNPLDKYLTPASPAGPNPLDKYITPSEDGGLGDYLGPALATGALALGAVALKNPGLVKSGLNQFNNARVAAMLTSWAPLKSTLGNIGAVGNVAMETGSLKPIKEFARLQTVKDAIRGFRQGGTGAYGTHISPGPERWYNVPGRFMGAMDEATGKALERAGLQTAKPLPGGGTVDEVAEQLLQSPISPRFAAALENNPIAQAIVPFPRIPFNQFFAGLDSMRNFTTLPTTMEQGRRLALTLGHMGLGAGVGANTEGIVPIGLNAAFAGRYGLPAIAGQAAGRLLFGGNARETVYGASPVSDFGFYNTLTDPLKPFTSLLERTGIRQP